MKERPAQSFGRAGSIEIIILFTAFIAATYGFGIYLFASLIPEMRAEIGFDYAAVGLMTASAQGGFLVFALISGLFASVIGGRKAIIFSVFLCAACLCLMPFSGNSWIVGVLLALMAAAAASVWVPMVAVCKELIPAKHQGKAFGLISSGTAYGVFINGLALPLLMPSYGWKSIWLVLGLLTLGLALWAMLRIGLRDQPMQSGTTSNPVPLGSRLRVLGRPEALAILLMMFLNGLSCMPAQNYLSAMMREELGYSVGSAALAWSIIGIVGMFSGLAVGAFADRISIRWAMVVTYALLCVAAAFFLNHASLVVIYAGAVAFGLAFYAIFGLVPAYMRDMGDGAPSVSGYDTPEIKSRRCEQELKLGRAAKARMEELLHMRGVQVFDSGEVDNTHWHRPLVWVKLPDGRTIGKILIEEGLARHWTPDYKANWC